MKDYIVNYRQLLASDNSDIIREKFSCVLSPNEVITWDYVNELTFLVKADSEEDALRFALENLLKKFETVVINIGGDKLADREGYGYHKE